MHRITASLTQLVASIQAEFVTTYTLVTKIVFVLFMCLQVITLVFIRARLISNMRKDLVKSMAMLILVPEKSMVEVKNSNNT